MAAGETVIGFVDKEPGCQIYVFALDAVIVVDTPAHRVVAEAEVLTTGNGFTVMVFVAVVIHPVALVPVMVYVVVLNGVTITDMPLKLPGCQL